jgi:hypothetical protein
VSAWFEHAKRLRAQLGLRHDRAFIEVLAQQTHLNTSELGIPITDEELADLQQRRALGAYIPAIIKLLRGDSNYASIWFDQIPGGVVRIALTSTPTPRQVQAVAQLLPDGARVAYDTVRYSQAELQALYAELDEATAFTPSSGKLVVTGLSVDGRNNAVEVSFRDEWQLRAFTERFSSDPRIKTKIHPAPNDARLSH